jgi:hypothetical protein
VTNDNVRKQCPAVRNINEIGINAQDAILRHVTGTRFLSGRRICGPHRAKLLFELDKISTRIAALKKKHSA